jgi:sulfofructose kinase
VQLPLTLPAPETKSFDVVGFGQNSLDLLVRIDRHPVADSSAPVEGLIRLPGGEVATAMVACARLGCRVRYVGTIGTDEAGAQVEAALKREGLDTSCVRRVDAPNRFAIILVDREGHRTVLWHRDPGIATRPDDIDPMVVTRGRVLLVDAIDPEASAAAATAARAAGIPTVVDVDQVRPGVEALLREIDIVIASGSFSQAYTGASSVGQALERLAAEFRPAVVIATLGAEGSLARCEGQEIRTRAYDVPVVDTTGAGDAFRGGFVAAWLREGTTVRLSRVLAYATAVAGLNCRELGAQGGLPLWSEVDVLVTGTGYARSK